MLHHLDPEHVHNCVFWYHILSSTAICNNRRGGKHQTWGQFWVLGWVQRVLLNHIYTKKSHLLGPVFLPVTLSPEQTAQLEQWWKGRSRGATGSQKKAVSFLYSLASWVPSFAKFCFWGGASKWAASHYPCVWQAALEDNHIKMFSSWIKPSLKYTSSTVLTQHDRDKHTSAKRRFTMSASL